MRQSKKFAANAVQTAPLWAVFGHMGAWLPLLLLLISAGVVRFYNLGVPSMWWDEVLTAITATFPPEYILHWSKDFEVHPPLYYFITKWLSQAGSSDSALRFPSAALGLLHILLIFAFCWRYISRLAGFATAAILAALPLHILLSRQLRPYPLIMVLQTLSLYLLRLWIDNRSPLVIVGMAFVSLVLSSLHYMGIGFVGLQIIFITGYLAVVRPPAAWKRWLVFCLANGIACLPGMYFFLTIRIRNDMIFASPVAEVIQHILLAIDAAFRPLVMDMPLDESAGVFFAATWICLLLFAALGLVGMQELWRRDRFLAIFIPYYQVAYLLTIVCSGQGFFRPRHLLPGLLPAILLAGCALSRWLPVRGFRNGLVVAVVVLLPFAALLEKKDKLYLPDSYASYKQQAQAASRLQSDASAFSTSSMDLYNALGWYCNKMTVANPLASVHLTPDTTMVRFNYIVESRLDSLSQADRLFLATLGPPTNASMLYNLPVLTWDWERTPVHTVSGLSQSFLFEATPEAVFRDSYAVHDMLLIPESKLVTASENNRHGELAYAFDFPLGSPQTVVVSAQFKTTGPGNHLEFRYSLDGGAPQVAFASESLEAGPLSYAYFAIKSAAPYKRLVVTCSVVIGRETPAYPGGNLGTNGLFQLRVACLPSEPALPESIEAITVHGLGKREMLLGGVARWGEGPRLTAVLNCSRQATVQFALTYASPLRDLGLRLLLNGQEISSWSATPAQGNAWSEVAFDVNVRQGRNELVLVSDKYNHRPHALADTFAPDDPRKLALIIRHFSLGNAQLID